MDKIIKLLSLVLIMSACLEAAQNTAVKRDRSDGIGTNCKPGQNCLTGDGGDGIGKGGDEEPLAKVEVRHLIDLVP